MDENLYYFGENIKLVGNTVQGYLVRFGNPNDTDLEGDYFTPNTDFGRPLKDGQKFALNLYYHHGQDNVIGTKSIGSGFVSMDDKGLWMSAQIEMNDEYNKMIMELAKQGKLGYSSGAASHMVERKSVGKSYEIQRWTLAEASLTPRPAESRNIVTAKALSELKAMPEDLKVGDFVRWNSSGGSAVGKITDINKSGVLSAEPTGPEMEGTEEEPAYKVNVYKEMDGSYEASDVYVVHRAEKLNKIDKPGKEVTINVCPHCGEEMEEDEEGEKYCKMCGYKPGKKSFTPHRPEDIRDAEKTLREAMLLSRSEAKKLANVLWNSLCDAKETEEEVIETKSVQDEEENNSKIKLMLLKKAMLDLIGD